MRKVMLLAAVGLLAAGGVTSAYACACHLGRGVRFERTSRAARPASVLIYVCQQTGKSTLGGKELQSILKQAGHKIETVQDASTLEQNVKSGKFDLVLAEYPDAVDVAEIVKASSANAVILPVMGKSQKVEYPAATKQFAYVVKSMSDPSEYLSKIDQVMKTRPGAVAGVLLTAR